MPARLYLDEIQLKSVGFDPRMVATFRELVKVADAFNRLTTVEGDQSDLEDDLTDANNTIDSLDNRLDIVEAFTNFDPRYVRQDQGAAWTNATGTAARTALASYAGQTVSNPPTQVEMQALDDAVKAISQHLVAFINDAKSNGTLT